VKTRLRLLLMFVTFAGLFAGTWHFFVRERPQQVPAPPPKTTQELLVGTWRIVEQQPPLSPEYTAKLELAPDGKVVLHMIHTQLGPNVPTTGVYRLKGNVLEIDFAESPYGPPRGREFRMESLTNETLIVVALGDDPMRTVLARE
jgi:hypothetical protein